MPLAAVGWNRPLMSSVTRTVPLLGAPPWLVTVIVYVAPVCPWKKLPVWVFVTVRSGPAVMPVTSVAVLLAGLTSPPPETVAVFVSDAGALGRHVHGHVIGG